MITWSRPKWWSEDRKRQLRNSTQARLGFWAGSTCFIYQLVLSFYNKLIKFVKKYNNYFIITMFSFLSFWKIYVLIHLKVINYIMTDESNNLLFPANDPEVAVESTVYACARNAMWRQRLHRHPSRNQPQLRKHHERLEVDRRGPKCISPCAQVVARVDHASQQKTPRYQNPRRKMHLLRDCVIPNRFHQQIHLTELKRIVNLIIFNKFNNGSD